MKNPIASSGPNNEIIPHLLASTVLQMKLQNMPIGNPVTPISAPTRTHLLLRPVFRKTIREQKQAADSIERQLRLAYAKSTIIKELGV